MNSINSLYWRENSEVNKEKSYFLSPFDGAETNLIFIPHAAKRMAQRNLKPEEIDFVIRFGTLIRRTGVQFYFLGKRDIPPDLLKPGSRLIGITVIFGNCEVKTAYRNPMAFKHIKKKSKKNLKKNMKY